MDRISNEILHKILFSLDYKSATQARLVCKDWATILNTNYYYRTLCIKHGLRNIIYSNQINWRAIWFRLYKAEPTDIVRPDMFSMYPIFLHENFKPVHFTQSTQLKINLKRTQSVIYNLVISFTTESNMIKSKKPASLQFEFWCDDQKVYHRKMRDFHHTTGFRFLSSYIASHIIIICEGPCTISKIFVIGY